MEELRKQREVEIHLNANQLLIRKNFPPLF